MAPTRLASAEVWQALDKASYAVVAFVGADGQPCSSGVVAPGSVEIESVSKRLARMLPEQRKSGAVLEREPVGTFLAYGIGVSLREMVDPAKSLARVPVDTELGR